VTPREPIESNDSLLTGADEIDQQHDILINTLNEVESKLAGKPSHQLFEQITRDLLAYAIYHFEEEEQLIKRHGYDVAEPEDAAVHIRQHRVFSDRVIALRSEADIGEKVAQGALLSFLKDWWMNHICTTDRRLIEFIRAREARMKSGTPGTP
jgi:hemerythrin